MLLFLMPSTSTLFQVSHYIDVLRSTSKRKLALVSNVIQGESLVVMQLRALVTCIWMSSPLLITDTQTCELMEEASIQFPKRHWPKVV